MTIKPFQESSHYTSALFIKQQDRTNNFLPHHPEGFWVCMSSGYRLLQCQDERMELKKKHENLKFVGVLNKRFVITKIQLLW